MIYTCTISPSVDYTTYLNQFSTGELNRTNEVYFYPGGKGINISRVLQRLGAETKALGFLGGFTGHYIKGFLDNENVTNNFIQTDEITRINVKVKADTETELNGPGPSIQEEKQNDLLNQVDTFKSGDWFVLAGSLPQLSDAQFYEKISKKCAKKGINFVLDTSGEALKELISTKPFLIKPNQDELGELFNTTIHNQQEAIHYANKLVKQGIKHVIVSLGGDGALLVNESATITATAPKGKAVNTVGAGDSLVAGFLAAYTSGKDATESFRYAVASGSATAFQSDLCDKQDVEELLSEVKLKKITTRSDKL